MPEPRPARAPFAIAIDGPASSGKGTVARAVARGLGFSYVDTGAMYRAVALEAARRGLDLGDGEALGRLARGLDLDFRWGGEGLTVLLGGRDVSEALRGEAAGQGASAVAVHPPVRAALLELQRGLARGGDVVMDGRDIGTVVLPEAALKVYLDAALDERARRRHRELAQRGVHTSYELVYRELAERDARDMGRAAAPLRAAGDAVVLDTTALSAGEAAEQIIELARARGA